MSLTLSICIPTYNRAAYLAQTLENIIAQSTDEVEIVVSDNASPDATEEVVRGFQSRFPRLTYFRQPENKGADRNYLNAVSLGTGDYCWLFGDDDLMADGAIPLLLEKYLTASPESGVRLPEFVQLSVEVWDLTMSKAKESSADALGVTEDYRTTDVPAYFVQFFRESFLSGFVVRRDLWAGVDADKYLGTGLSYQAIVYEYLQPDSPVVFVARPLVKYRAGNPSWSGELLDITIGHMHHLLDSLPHRYDPFKAAAQRGFEKRLPITLATLARLRADGHYDVGYYRKYMHQYYAAYPLYRILGYLIAVTPTDVLSKLRAVYKDRKQASA